LSSWIPEWRNQTPAWSKTASTLESNF